MLMEQLEIKTLYTLEGRSEVDEKSGKQWTNNMAFKPPWWTSYGIIGVNQEQQFLFEEVVADGNSWVLQDPTINERIAKRIVDVWRPLVEKRFKIPPECLERKLSTFGKGN
jgi:hypothetical protein